jgi:hypothetical protein
MESQWSPDRPSHTYPRRCVSSGQAHNRPVAEYNSAPQGSRASIGFLPSAFSHRFPPRPALYSVHYPRFRTLGGAT